MDTPKFKTGDIVRYSTGSTALMLIETISKNHGGEGIYRYYGRQYYGDTVGSYEKDCKLASKTDVENWLIRNQ